MADEFNESAEERGPAREQKGMSDDEVRYITDREITESSSWATGAIANERIKAMEYYLGLPQGDLAPSPIPGRSQIVSTDVADTIEWMLPALIEIFTAGDDVVEFSPLKQGDEEGAQQTTDLVNHVFYQENPGWLVLYTWFKDALLQKNGIVKVSWDKTAKPTQESYQDLSDMQLTMLMQDDEIEIIEQMQHPDEKALQAMQVQYAQALQMWQRGGEMSGQPAPQQPDPSQIPMLWDVTVMSKASCGQIVVDNVPPEEFLISRFAKSIKQGPCGMRVKRSMSWLKEQGYSDDELSNITSDEFPNPTMSGESIVRRSLEDAPYGYEDHDTGDETTRAVWLTEWYTQIDVDGDGVAEWRKILRAGNGILENEPCDGPPFASLCPVPLPHLFYGLSISDQAMTVQKLRTTIWRGIIDNMHLQINGRVWAVENQVNLDDLLSIRPGGVVRVQNPNAVGPLVQGMTDTASAFGLLDKADEMRQDRTGVTRYTQGSDADTLNKTAQGLENITQRADMRVKLIARIFAETGVKDLFLLIQKLLGQHQDKPKTIKLRGNWAEVDPRAWKNKYGMVANVGLGTGDKTKQIQHLTMLGQVQQQAMGIGAATPANMYKALQKLPPLLGFKNGDEFFTDPANAPQKPPEQNPDVMKVQAEHEAKMQEIKMRAESDTHRAMLEDAREKAKQERDAEWEREKFYATLSMQREIAILKTGVNPLQESSLYANLDKEGDSYAKSGIRGFGGAEALGADSEGGTGQGFTQPPTDGGGFAEDASGFNQGLGGQPGA